MFIVVELCVFVLLCFARKRICCACFPVCCEFVLASVAWWAPITIGNAEAVTRPKGVLLVVVIVNAIIIKLNVLRIISHTIMIQL